MGPRKEIEILALRLAHLGARCVPGAQALQAGTLKELVKVPCASPRDYLTSRSTSPTPMGREEASTALSTCCMLELVDRCLLPLMALMKCSNGCMIGLIS